MTSLHNFSTYERNDTEFHRGFKYRDPKHTPSNKRVGEEESVMIFSVQAHKKAGWLSFRTEEYRTNKKNDVREIASYVTLTNEQAIALRDMLNEQFPVPRFSHNVEDNND